VTRDLQFGWHMPSRPVDGSNAAVFLEQVQQALQHIQPHVDSVRVEDHVIPGAAWLPNDTPLYCHPKVSPSRGLGEKIRIL